MIANVQLIVGTNSQGILVQGGVFLTEVSKDGTHLPTYALPPKWEVSVNAVLGEG